MSYTLADFNRLSTAEEYLEFFGLDFDPAVVNVNRLHILRKFSQFVQALNLDSSISESDRLDQYRVALQNAYSVFLSSSSVEQKLFKVFQQKPANVVLLSEIPVD